MMKAPVEHVLKRIEELRKQMSNPYITDKNKAKLWEVYELNLLVLKKLDPENKVLKITPTIKKEIFNDKT